MNATGLTETTHRQPVRAGRANILRTTTGSALGITGGRTNIVHNRIRFQNDHPTNCGRLGTNLQTTTRPLTCSDSSFSTIHSTYYYSYLKTFSDVLERDNHFPPPMNKNGSN